MTVKRRRADAVKLDMLLEKECKKFVEQGVIPTARKLATQLGCQPSTLTRDTVRAEIIARFRSEFEERKRWSKRLEKSSKRADAELLRRKDRDIELLRRQVDALLLSHRSMIDVLRENGNYDSWRLFLKRYIEVENELLELSIFTAEDTNSV